ncbi:MAG: transposase family protein [Streptomycetaceae bacterium]|nr:transposase family protein [Streptomycetaceae bacterium]
MNNNDTEINTAATHLLGIEGVGVVHVEDDGAGGTVVHVVTTNASARACPSCGVFATSRKERVVTRPRHLSCGGRTAVIRWHKSRWRCAESQCPRTSFTEQTRQIPARMRLTEALRHQAGKAVADGGRTVVQAGRDLGLSWPTVQQAFAEYAAHVLD